MFATDAVVANCNKGAFGIIVLQITWRSTSSRIMTFCEQYFSETSKPALSQKINVYLMTDPDEILNGTTFGVSSYRTLRERRAHKIFDPKSCPACNRALNTLRTVVLLS